MIEKKIRAIDANAAIERLRANFQQASQDGCENPFYQIAEETIAEMPTLLLENATEMRPDCNTPLPLEQLREMNGRPVWVETKAGSKFWAIVTNNCVSSGDGSYLWISEEDTEYGKTWLAYDYLPAHIHREAWEKRCSKCKYEDDEEGIPIYYQDDWDAGIGFERDDAIFCPKCGRPLTEEAWSMLKNRFMGVRA